jgi:hypothetical protein
MEMKERLIIKATCPLIIKEILMVYGMSCQELIKERVVLLIDTHSPPNIKASQKIFMGVVENI